MQKLMVFVLVWRMSTSVMGAGKELIENGGMEGPYQNGWPKGWHKNCYGINESVFREETKDVHGGKSALKVECKSFDGGAIQFLSRLKPTKGKYYRCSFWLRAEGGVNSVHALLRQCPAPYRTHVGKKFQPSTDWQQYIFEGICLENDDNAGFFLSFQPESGGTIWLDDVSVTETDPGQIVESGTPPTRNVLPNGSFEICPWRDWRVAVGEGIPDDAAALGKKSLRITGQGKPCEVRSRLIKFATGRKEFTLSTRAKGQGKVEITLMPGVVVGGQRPPMHLIVEPTDEWKPYSVTQVLEPSLNGAFYIRIALSPSENGAIWLDGLCLQPGDSSGPWSAAAPVEFALATDKTAGIFRQGEPVKILIEACNESDGPANQEMVCRLLDFWGKEAARLPCPIRVPPGEAVSVPVTLPIHGTGIYRAELTRRGEETVLAALCFSVLPPVNPTPAADSNVGGHFRLDDFHMTVANLTGIKWTRIHDASTITHWQTAEPEKGKFQWFDEEVDIVKNHGVEILGEFLRTPEWASSAPQDIPDGTKRTFPPRDMGEYMNYVRTVVSHYRNRIHHWEIWNEPYGKGFFSGTAEQYAETAKASVKAAKEADPNCTLLGPCTCGHVPEWTAKVIAAGGLRAIDVFSYHGYGMYGFGAYERVGAYAGQDREKPLPIWNTETGASSTSFYTNLDDQYVDSYVRWLNPEPYEQAAALTVRYYVLALAGGAQKYFFYWTVYEDGLLPRLPAMSLFEYDGSLRPFGVAYAVAASLLDGAGFHAHVEVSPQVEAYVFLGCDGKAIAVLFGSNISPGKELHVSVPATNGRFLDIMGNAVPAKAANGSLIAPLGRMPIYLQAGGTPDGLSRALSAATVSSP